MKVKKIFAPSVSQGKRISVLLNGITPLYAFYIFLTLFQPLPNGTNTKKKERVAFLLLIYISVS